MRGQYTPETHAVRHLYALAAGGSLDEGRAEFRRWLEREHEAVREKARTDLYLELERSLLKEIDERGDTRISDDYIAGMRAAALIAKGEA